MTVFPDHPEVRDWLTLDYREMIKKGGKTTFQDLSEPMYELTSVPTENGTRQAALFSHQGFWKSLAEHLRGMNYKVTVRDVRHQVLAPPNLDAAMTGLLPPQRPWILEALNTGDSGLIGAPTRWGKSYGMTAIARAFPKAVTVVTAPGVDLCQQLLEHFQEILPHREVKGVFTGSRNSKQSDDITVCSIDSLDKMDPDLTELMIIDEPHAVVSDERMPKVAAFVKARKYGFGATLKGRFDRKDRLIEGLIGPVIANRTYRQGVELDMISPLVAVMVEIPFSKDTIPGGRFVDRDIVYQRLLTQSTRTAALVRKILEYCIPDDWQTMSFIQNEKQALFYLEHSVLPSDVQLPANGEEVDGEFVTREELMVKACMEQNRTIAMAKRMTKKRRKAVTDGIVAGTIQRVLASNIYVQGLTFPDLRVVLNLAGGGATTTAIQKPGRLLQKRPNKNYGVLVDFVFKCRDAHLENRQNPPYRQVVGECHARRKAYEEIGYDVRYVKNSDELRDIILGAYDQPESARHHVTESET